MNKTKAKELREFLTKTLEPLLKEKGFNIEIGNATFDNDHIKFNNLTISEEGALSKTEKDLKTFLKEQKLFGLKELLDAEKEVQDESLHVKLIGYRPRATKRPFIVSASDGNEYTITEATAFKLFGYPNVDSPQYVPKGTPLNKIFLEG